MLQRDYSELAVSSSHPFYGATGRETPLRQQGWRALGFWATAAWPSLTGIVRTLHRWRREAVTIRQLSALRDRELRDIGIERNQIPAIARSMADGSVAAHRAARTAPALKVVPRQGSAQPCCG